ncbi:MAG: hypothetical protein J6Z45_05915 [Oscillospiraceae bacterium]|nr:hypothetical protein [Oscillospiraceae bacterium]
MHTPFHPKGSGIVVLCTIFIFPLALLFVWLAAGTLTAENLFGAFAASVVLGVISGLTLQLAVLEKLQHYRKERIEKLCDTIAFLLIPAAIIAGLIWLMCRNK